MAGPVVAAALRLPEATSTILVRPDSRCGSLRSIEDSLLAPDAAAGRLEAMLNALDAVVWERDGDGGLPRFVSAGAEYLFGYPLDHWYEPGFWATVVHPDDRDMVEEAMRAGGAAGDPFEVTYRMIARDGRTRWLRDLVHVGLGPSGQPQLFGVATDITDAVRRKQEAELLAAIGETIAAPLPISERLAAVTERLVTSGTADLASVFLRGDDGRYRPVAAAPESAAPAVLAAEPITLPPELDAGYLAGRHRVVPDITEAVIRRGVRNDDDVRSFAALGVRTAVNVPLLTGGELVGVLSVSVTDRIRTVEAETTATVEEIGRRIAAMVAAERAAARQRHLLRVSAALAGAEDVAEIAGLVADALATALGASGHGVYLLEPAQRTDVRHGMPRRAPDPGHGTLRRVPTAAPSGYAAVVLQTYGTIAVTDDVPIAESARTGRAIWLADRGQWRARYPHLVENTIRGGNHAALSQPLRARGEVVAVVGASFATPQVFPPAVREFAATLAQVGGEAIARAAVAQRQDAVATVLQRSLLPAALPAHDRLALAAHYLPAAAHHQAGGDWYDVLPLDEHRVALMAGDVVGQGPAAAAVMGQLRAALAAHLVGGHGPAEAMSLLSAFSRHVPRAPVSSATCLVLDTASGVATWARAGHPPAMVIDPTAGARFLDEGDDPVLGLARPVRYREHTAVLTPGATVLLYTDGLVERRGEVVDDGLDRLMGEAARRRDEPPERLVIGVLQACLRGTTTGDDVAVLAARLLPGPLRRRVASSGDLPARVRREVRRWAGALALAADARDDLTLALDEAVTNAVEHAYAGHPGEVEYALEHTPDGVVVATVRDHGTWRPPPADPGFRGRGLALIRTLSTNASVVPGPDGTTVTFTLRA